MQAKILSVLGLAALSALVACADPQVRPAPDATSAPTPHTQDTPDQPAGNPGSPAASGATRDKVMTLLSGIEHIPSREEFARAGSDEQVAAALDSIARDSAAKLRHRANAAAGLGLYPVPSSRKTLESLINEPGLDEVLRRPAIKSYASAFGLDSVALVSKMLDHKDRSTRETALRALADVGGAPARQAVEARVKVESDESLKKIGQEALARWK